MNVRVRPVIIQSVILKPVQTPSLLYGNEHQRKEMKWRWNERGPRRKLGFQGHAKEKLYNHN